MPEGDTTVTGQVPSGQEPPAQTSGQVPPAAPQVPSSDPNAPQQQPQTPPQGNDPAKPQLTLEQALDALEKARKDAAKQRVDAKRLAELEAAQKAADDAKLSETERLQKQLAELQAKDAQATLATQERIVRAEVRAEAISKGINPVLAARLIDFADITYDEATGDPTNIAELLTKAIADFGLTASGTSQAQQPQAPQTPNPGGTNPPRQNEPMTITANQYLDPAFRSEFHKTHGMDILKAVNAGKVTIV